MKKIKKILLITLVLLASVLGLVHAEEPLVEIITVNLTLRSGEIVIFSGEIPLPASTTELNGKPVDPNSVLAILNDADLENDSWEISDLQYFESFGSFYLKCIDSSAGNNCDNWQYVINNDYPDVSMDQEILSGGENIYLYFGPQNKITLSSNSITTSETLTVTAEEYDYENNNWTTRGGVTAGLTQPNPDDPFSPIEILTASVDGNGQANFSGISEGSYSVGIKEDFYFPTEALTVAAALPQSSSSSSSGDSSSKSVRKKEPAPQVLGTATKAIFDLNKAFEFLIAQQKENGSFGETLYTDWTALALASGNYQEQVIKLIKYLGEFKIENPTLTDFERHAMTLMALGLNPHNTNGENYIKKIIESFDGKQFGDVNEDNDDIFALIVLKNAGYEFQEKIIQASASFILNRQRENGSWDESLDMTGAGIQALSSFTESEQIRPGDLQIEQIKNALAKAKEFLKKTQKDNGSWNDDTSSTAWVLGGIYALGEKPEDWIKNDHTPLDYLATLQDTDGGVKDENIKNKIWKTAYVVSALSGKTWNQMMQKFEKENLPLVIEPPKPIAPKPKIAQPKIKEAEIQNTATAVTAIAYPPTATQTEISKKGWFRRLLETIFGPF